MKLPERGDRHHRQGNVCHDGVHGHEVCDVVQDARIPAMSGQRRIPQLLDRRTLDVDNYARYKREDDLQHRDRIEKPSPPEPRVEETVDEDRDGDVGQSECN